MTARVLLVTGSRALSDTHAAEVWARGMLRERITRETVDSVVAGDARGPDAWAHEIARETDTECEKWALDGNVYVRTDWVWEYLSEWATEGEVVSRRGDRRWPLERNTAMVAGVGMYAQNKKVRCLALVAPWSRTHETQRTYLLALSHGLPVEVLTCPEAYGPRGSR